MDFEKLYIGGEWVPSETGDWIEVVNPADRKVFARVPAAGKEDVSRAAAAAKRAFPAWRDTPLAERKALMERFLSEFRAAEDELISLTVKELGSPRDFTKTTQVDYQYTRTRSYIDLADGVPLVEKMPFSTVFREPVGVVGCITPWNYPLGQVIQKVVPAILMGNTVVLKPSQHTPLSSFVLARCFEKAGFPAGVFNLVTGRGAEVGGAMSSSPDIGMISFTGSTSGGVTVSRSALESVKRISLELGGKSPYVILPGCKDYEKPVRICFNSIFMNSGQTCTAFSRLLVPREELPEIEKTLLRLVPEYAPGDPEKSGVKLGPVASGRQFEKIRSYIKKGLGEGLGMIAGRVPEDPAEGEGWVIPPVIFSPVRNESVLAREEIFGPVLCVIPYDGAEDAVRIANDTSYGLNAGVWGEKKLAVSVARRICAGNVYVNDGPRDCAAPFGGWKTSGIGREGGVWGMIEFTQQKALFDAGTEENP